MADVLLPNVGTYGIIQDTIYLGYGVAAAVVGQNYNLYRASTPILPLSGAPFLAPISASFNINFAYNKANKYGNAVFQLLVDGRFTQPNDFLQIQPGISLTVASNTITVTGAPAPYIVFVIQIDSNVYQYEIQNYDTLDTIAANFAAMIPNASAAANVITLSDPFTVCETYALAQTWYIASMQEMLPILAVQCNHFVTVERANQSKANGYTSGQYAGYVPATAVAGLQASVISSGLPVSILSINHGRKSEMKLPTDADMPYMTILLPALGDIVYKNRDIVIDEQANRYVIISNELTPLGWRCIAELLGT
jgi:hypothetical protein